MVSGDGNSTVKVVVVSLHRRGNHVSGHIKKHVIFNGGIDGESTIQPLNVSGTLFNRCMLL